MAEQNEKAAELPEGRDEYLRERDTARFNVLIMTNRLEGLDKEVLVREIHVLLSLIHACMGLAIERKRTGLSTRVIIPHQLMYLTIFSFNRCAFMYHLI